VRPEEWRVTRKYFRRASAALRTGSESPMSPRPAKTGGIHRPNGFGFDGYSGAMLWGTNAISQNSVNPRGAAFEDSPETNLPSSSRIYCGAERPSEKQAR
jgi:hypothetical protein